VISEKGNGVYVRMKMREGKEVLKKGQFSDSRLGGITQRRWKDFH